RHFFALGHPRDGHHALGTGRGWQDRGTAIVAIGHEPFAAALGRNARLLAAAARELRLARSTRGHVERQPGGLAASVVEQGLARGAAGVGRAGILGAGVVRPPAADEEKREHGEEQGKSGDGVFASPSHGAVAWSHVWRARQLTSLASRSVLPSGGGAP